MRQPIDDGEVDALIGFTGFVGSTLLRQRNFGHLYRSSNIAESGGRSFGLVVCAGAPAQKWIANRDPHGDARNIDALIGHLRGIRCETLVLISTVDVFASPVAVSEYSSVDTQGLHAYGSNRRRLEEAVGELFPRHLVVRLPGLVGPGLRKNVIYDLHNDNNLGAIDSRGVFQYYPMVNLWADLQMALQASLPLVHLTAEPLSVEEVAWGGFGRKFEQPGPGASARYDLRTQHAALFGGHGAYQYSRREALLAIRAYAQSEPKAPAK
jgi:hypothetical protein